MKFLSYDDAKDSFNVTSKILVFATAALLNLTQKCIHRKQKFNLWPCPEKNTATEVREKNKERHSIKEIGNSIRKNFIGVCCVREFFRWWTRKKPFYLFIIHSLVSFSVI